MSRPPSSAAHAATALFAALTLTSCAAAGPVLDTPSGPTPAVIAASEFDDEWGGNGGSWVVRSEECLDVAEMQELSDYTLVDTNSIATLLGSCVYANADYTYGIGYSQIFIPAVDGSSAYVEAPSLGVGARTTQQAIFGGNGCIVTVPIAGEQDTYLYITTNGGPDVDWTEKCADAVQYLAILADQQEPTEKAPVDASSSDWVDCGPSDASPINAYRTAEGSFTICADYSGYLKDSEFGPLAVVDVGGAGGNACGSPLGDEIKAQEVCTDGSTFVYFFGLGTSDEVARPILETWKG